MIYDMIYLTAIGQPPGGSSSVHIYTQTVQRTTQTVHRRTKKKYIEQHKKEEECGPGPAFAGFTLAFALQLRKKHILRRICLLQRVIEGKIKGGYK
jgi:hypothetical protein